MKIAFKQLDSMDFGGWKKFYLKERKQAKKERKPIVQLAGLKLQG